MTIGPSRERNKKRSITDNSTYEIYHFIIGKSCVSTVMSNNEKSPAEKSDQIPPDEFTDESKIEEIVL